MASTIELTPERRGQKTGEVWTLGWLNSLASRSFHFVEDPANFAAHFCGHHFCYGLKSACERFAANRNSSICRRGVISHILPINLD
jgi:hypothetical protein